MTKRRLLIASPAKNGLGTHYITLFSEALQKGLEGWSIDYLVEAANAALHISRDILANDAVTGGFDRMLFLDTDHPATMEHIRRILSHDHDEFQIVSGLYCMKRPGKPFFLGIKAKGAQPRPDGLLEADFLPTGFLSVSTAALRTMQQAHPDREVYVQDNVLLPPGPRPTRSTMFDLFPIGPQGSRTPQSRLRRIRKAMETIIAKGVTGTTRPQMLEALQHVAAALTDVGEPGYQTGEDYSFTWLARQAGIKCWLDVGCLVPHLGSIPLPMTNPALLATECDQIPEAEGDQTLW